MEAYLSGGPAHGRVIPHPNMHLWRVAVPRPLTLKDCLQESIDASVLPDIPIADYQFTGQAVVTMSGKIRFMLYRFTGMEL